MRIIFRILLTYMQICIKISVMTDSKEMIKKLGLTPNKALGQNFLIDTEAISRIAALADCQGENVLEIGPGLGALTSALSEKAKNLLAVEIDRTLVGILADEFADKRSVQLICSDFLKVPPAKISDAFGGEPFTVAANLPYYITSPICMRLIESGLPVKRMVLMMQVEAAERFFAAPRDVNYGPLSIVSRYLFDISTELKLSPAAYYPEPSVHSCVLKFERNGSELPPNFIKVLRAAFAMRRKTLRNNMLQLIPKNNVDEVIADAGLLPTVRAEELAAANFVRLADSYNRYGNKVSEADPTCAE